MLPYISLFGLRIPCYGICVTTGFLLVSLIMGIRAKKKGISGDLSLTIAAFALVGILIGGMGLYLFVTYPISQIIDSIRRLDFTFIKGGGIVFYGGLMGGILGVYAGCKLLKIPMFVLEDCLVPFVPLGHAIGRIGCLFGGCCFGFPYDGIFAVHSLLASPTQTFFPVQVLEAFLDILIMLYLLHYAKKTRRNYDLAFRYLTLYAVMRFCTELLRGDVIRGHFGILSTSQWISVGILTVALIRHIYLARRGDGDEK